MTKEEAIAILQKIKPIPRRVDSKSTTHILKTIALDMAIQALEQKPCDDCISRKELLKEITEIDYGCNMDIYTNEVREIVNELPSIQPKANNVIDDIRAEIEGIELLANYTRGDIKRMALDIIDKYKAGSEDKK